MKPRLADELLQLAERWDRDPTRSREDTIILSIIFGILGTAPFPKALHALGKVVHAFSTQHIEALEAESRQLDRDEAELN